MHVPTHTGLLHLPYTKKMVCADQWGSVYVQVPSSDCPRCWAQHGPDWRVCFCSAVSCKSAGPHALPSLHAPHGLAACPMQCSNVVSMLLWFQCSDLAACSSNAAVVLCGLSFVYCIEAYRWHV